MKNQNNPQPILGLNALSKFQQSNEYQPQHLITLQQKIGIVFPHFSIKSLTFGIFMTNVLIWILQLSTSAFWHHNWDCTLYVFQAKFQPGIVYNYEIWRLILSSIMFKTTSMFIYNNLTINMIGYANEKQNKRRYITIFYGCIIVGNMCSCIFNPTNFLAAGPSSGTIGLLPTEIYRFLRIRRLPVAKRRIIQLTMNMIISFVLNLEGVIGINNVDWVSHFAALILGILLGTIFQDFSVFPQRIQIHKQKIRLVLIIITGLLVVGVIIQTFIVGRVIGWGRSELDYYKNMCFYSN